MFVEEKELLACGENKFTAAITTGQEPVHKVHITSPFQREEDRYVRNKQSHNKRSLLSSLMFGGPCRGCAAAVKKVETVLRITRSQRSRDRLLSCHTSDLKYDR
ncbi:hypothetical protein [Granulicella arctica]|uniref:hypothetical protein n=1 Tax=Granulicella arctica TaxID=940613 RepID=UPI0021DFB647|nr:hypothetical protein [Granulicella arctica]